MDSNTKKELENLTGQLEDTQLKIEGLMFDAFNQQDKQLEAIQTGMGLLTEVLAHMDAASFEMENVIRQLQEIKENKQSKKAVWMTSFAEEELTLLRELAEVLERLRQGQENSLSCVHSIEEEIANQRMFIEGICAAAEEAQQE